METTLPVDEDTIVDSAVNQDSCSVWLKDADGNEVWFTGDFAVLAELGRKWVAEFDVAANGRNPDAVIDSLYSPEAQEWWGAKAAALVNPDAPTLDKIDEKIDNLERLLTERNGGDDARYPADMQPGDWVRFPPARAWRKIDRVAEMDVGPWHVHYTYGGTAYFQPVRAETRYPYCPAARFDEVCDK